MLKELLEQIQAELAEKGFVLGNNPFSPELIVQHKVDTRDMMKRAGRATTPLDPLPEPTIQYVIFPTSTRLDPILRDFKGEGPIAAVTTVRISLLVPMFKDNKMNSLWRSLEIEEDVERIINKTRSISNGTGRIAANGFYDNTSRQITNEYIRSDITFTIKHQMLNGGA